MTRRTFLIIFIILVSTTIGILLISATAEASVIALLKEAKTTRQDCRMVYSGMYGGIMQYYTRCVDVEVPLIQPNATSTVATSTVGKKVQAALPRTDDKTLKIKQLEKQIAQLTALLQALKEEKAL